MQEGLHGRRRAPWLAIVAALAVLALAVAACGGDDEEAGGGAGAAQGADSAAAKAEIEATLQDARKGIVEFETPERGSGDGL
jgi:hypothetical protein